MKSVLGKGFSQESCNITYFHITVQLGAQNNFLILLAYIELLHHVSSLNITEGRAQELCTHPLNAGRNIHSSLSCSSTNIPVAFQFTAVYQESTFKTRKRLGIRKALNCFRGLHYCWWLNEETEVLKESSSFCLYNDPFTHA